VTDELKDAILEALEYCTANHEKGHLGYAVSYLQNMDRAVREYGDSALPVQLLYALNNMGAWKGEDARRVKAVLKKYTKIG